MGVKRFQHTLRELHTLRHDRLELQYLNAMNYRHAKPTIADTLRNVNQHAPFPPFDDKKSYAGFVPAAAYLRWVHTTILDGLRPLMSKQMMTPDGQIFKSDHSFKIIKKLAKVTEASEFCALYSFCKEYKEIHMQRPAPTKSLTHLQTSFQGMARPYRLCGHKLPEVFIH
ncbi:hypothetical protein EC973_002275 [Apophysomyces ossiformis]|uniref:Uncharacterized protein n=1 Tax=Apophysomyces ossiformis TaxID=679940 RepID=A0A8H7BIK4_9FUNG|nr:hypothetical protein EC973_002275 [Apophysomyces ossiformis]